MERAERIGLNEAVFREVNERISDLAGQFGLETQPLDLVCECGDPACVDRISMSRDEYEQLRSNPTHFTIFPKHKLLNIKNIITHNNPYNIIHKHKNNPT